MLATTKLHTPNQTVSLIHKKNTVFAFHMPQPDNINITSSRVICFKQPEDAQNCLDYIVEFTRAYGTLPPRSNEETVRMAESLHKIPLPKRKSKSQVLKQHNLKTFSLQLYDVFPYCKHNDLGILVCNQFTYSTDDEEKYQIKFKVDEIVDPISTLGEQKERIEKQFTRNIKKKRVL